MPVKANTVKASHLKIVANSDLGLGSFLMGTVKFGKLNGYDRWLSKYPLLKSGTIVNLNLNELGMKIIKSNYTFKLAGFYEQSTDALRTKFKFPRFKRVHS